MAVLIDRNHNPSFLNQYEIIKDQGLITGKIQLIFIMFLL
jgi:hypothetical protein